MTRISKGDKIIIENEEDPYNRGNFINAEIDRRNYGELIITAVNGERCVQNIKTTPKLHYPIGLNYTFHFPKEIKKVESYEKLDGTNILQYIYKDANNKSFISYKTRLTLFPNEEFRALLSKILKRYPAMQQLPIENKCNMSYELYGYLNPITIYYERDIDIAVLFGITHRGLIKSLSYLKTIDVPRARLISEIDTKTLKESIPTETLIEGYYREKALLEEELIGVGEPMVLKDKDEIPIRNKQGEIIQSYATYKGKEGSVWYCHLDHYTQLYKLKPDTIESIHHYQSGKGSRMGKIAIRNTLINAMEDLFILSYDNVIPYLEEEYSEIEISLYEDYIKQQILELNSQKEYEREILKVYNENNLDIEKDKTSTMRFFAKLYGNTKTVAVFNVLKKYFEIRAYQL